MTTVVTGLLVLLAFYFVIVKRRSVAGPKSTSGTIGGNAFRKPTKNSALPRSPWRATSIVPDESSCDAVKRVAGKRFLDTERAIPKLPLPGCDAAVCNCKYARHEDRRDAAEDRRIPNALQAQLHEQQGKSNRRTRRRGRRKTDWG